MIGKLFGGSMVILQVTFMILKLNGSIDWPIFWVFSPLLIPSILMILILLIIKLLFEEVEK